MLRPRGTKSIGAFFKQSVSDFDIDLGLLVGSQLMRRDVCVEVLETVCLQADSERSRQSLSV